MSCRASGLVLSLLISFASARASAQTAGGAGGVSVPPAGDAATAVAPPLARPPDDAARTKRLAELRARTDAEIAKQVAYGHQDAFLAAAKARPGNSKKVKWTPVTDGWVPTASLQRYEHWSTPAPDRTEIRALDVALENHPFRVVVDLDRELRARGVDFLLVKFPTRVQLYPELVVPALPAEGMRAFTLASLRFDALLLDAGVEVVNLAPLFFEHRFGDDRSDLLFLRADPHWTPRCSELAARSAADAILARGVAPGPAREGRDFVADRLRLEFRPISLYKPDEAGPESVVAPRVRTARGKTVDPEDDASPVCVVGDSFVHMHDGWASGFELELYRFLGRKIDSIAPEGGGEFGAREGLQRRRDDLPKKRIVVWLVSEQNFCVGATWAPRRLFE